MLKWMFNKKIIKIMKNLLILRKKFFLFERFVLLCSNVILFRLFLKVFLKCDYLLC